MSVSYSYSYGSGSSIAESAAAQKKNPLKQALAIAAAQRKKSLAPPKKEESEVKSQPVGVPGSKTETTKPHTDATTKSNKSHTVSSSGTSGSKHKKSEKKFMNDGKSFNFGGCNPCGLRFRKITCIRTLCNPCAPYGTPCAPAPPYCPSPPAYYCCMQPPAPPLPPPQPRRAIAIINPTPEFQEKYIREMLRVRDTKEREPSEEHEHENEHEHPHHHRHKSKSKSRKISEETQVDSPPESRRQIRRHTMKEHHKARASKGEDGARLSRGSSGLTETLLRQQELSELEKLKRERDQAEKISKYFASMERTKEGESYERMLRMSRDMELLGSVVPEFGEEIEIEEEQQDEEEAQEEAVLEEEVEPEAEAVVEAEEPEVVPLPPVEPPLPAKEPEPEPIHDDLPFEEPPELPHVKMWKTKIVRARKGSRKLSRKSSKNDDESEDPSMLLKTVQLWKQPRIHRKSSTRKHDMDAVLAALEAEEEEEETETAAPSSILRSAESEHW